MRQRFEHAAGWLFLRFLGCLPRAIARPAAVGVATLLFSLRPSLRRAANFNLSLAFPLWTDAERRQVEREMIRNLGWMAVEFARFPRYTRKNIESVIVLDGFENFTAAEQRGKGVLFLTGHMGAWELGPFAHALYHKPLHFLVRPIDNLLVDALVNRYRCLRGNLPIPKNQSARATLRVLREGGVVGILADQNTAPEEAIFVDFFGTPAATTTGIARLAQRTGAAVVPAYTFWDSAQRKYHLRYDPEIELSHSGDEETDIRQDTAKFNKAIEGYVRRFPGQWVWIHRRWKTRPPGDAALYPDQR